MSEEDKIAKILGAGLNPKELKGRYDRYMVSKQYLKEEHLEFHRKNVKQYEDYNGMKWEDF